MSAARRLVLLVLAIFLTVLAVPARAAETDPDDENIPSTAVARLKVSKGTVWVRPADSREWEEYSNNFPVAERSRVSVPQGSEAELQFRGSQFMLLVSGAEVDVLQLGDQQVSFRLRSGQVALSLSKDGFAPVRVKVPGNREVRLDAPGRYWLTIDGGVTKLLVRAGEVSVTGVGTSPVAVKAGEEASIGKEVKVSRAASPGSAATDKVAETPLTEAEQKAGVPQEAATELRQYGEWVSTPEYGYAWKPYVADGWAPYYYGRWSWVYPYGWTWVGNEPWGWWPYHYGGWVSYPAFGWVWCPFNTFFSVGFAWGGNPYWYQQRVLLSRERALREQRRVHPLGPRAAGSCGAPFRPLRAGRCPPCAVEPATGSRHRHGPGPGGQAGALGRARRSRPGRGIQSRNGRPAHGERCRVVRRKERRGRRRFRRDGQPRKGRIGRRGKRASLLRRRGQGIRRPPPDLRRPVAFPIDGRGLLGVFRGRRTRARLRKPGRPIRRCRTRRRIPRLRWTRRLRHVGPRLQLRLAGIRRL